MCPNRQNALFIGQSGRMTPPNRPESGAPGLLFHHRSRRANLSQVRDSTHGAAYHLRANPSKVVAERLILEDRSLVISAPLALPVVRAPFVIPRIPADPARADGLRTSVRLATLYRGAHFLAGGCRPPGCSGPTAVTGPHRAKVIGNSLRELDRFLNLLADEVGQAMLLPPRAHQAARHEHNTANKIRSLRHSRGLCSPDHDRLRALGRSRDCMFHCDGLVRRGDGPDSGYLTLGWTDGAGAKADTAAPFVPRPLLRADVGERIEVSSLSLIDVGQFYLGAARSLIALID